MVSKHILTAITGCVLAGLAMSAHADQQSRFRGSGSGWGNASVETDVNGDGFFGNTGKLIVKSSVGQLETSFSQDVLPWDGVSICEIDEEPGILVEFSSTTSIHRAKNGDLIYTRLDPSETSTACIDFDFEIVSFEIFEVIVGGTGKFDGATGSYVAVGSGRNLSPVHGAIDKFEFDGNIVRARGHDDDD